MAINRFRRNNADQNGINANRNEEPNLDLFSALESRCLLSGVVGEAMGIAAHMPAGHAPRAPSEIVSMTNVSSQSAVSGVFASTSHGVDLSQYDFGAAVGGSLH